MCGHLQDPPYPAAYAWIDYLGIGAVFLGPVLLWQAGFRRTGLAIGTACTWLLWNRLCCLPDLV